MANGITSAFDIKSKGLQMNMNWDDNKLVFVVREPFHSKYSDISITAGFITKEIRLRIESLMPSQGLIFSDGIEADFLNFNSGSVVEIGIAEQKALIINN
jgi:hypothetical protein